MKSSYMTKCNTCNKDKSSDCFSKNKHSTSGYERRCKACCSNKAKDWYKNNKKRQMDLAREPRQRFIYSKKSAKGRNLKWNIDENSFYHLIQQLCQYCKREPIYTTGVGLDRLNNDIGYELSNVVPCCGPCNTSRNNNFSPEEWQVMIDALLKWKRQRDSNPL